MERRLEGLGAMPREKKLGHFVTHCEFYTQDRKIVILELRISCSLLERKLYYFYRIL